MSESRSESISEARSEPKRRTFCGYLHVKRPADQRYALIRPLSSWKRRLVTVLLDESCEDNERTNVVKILLGKKQASLASRNAQTGSAGGSNVQKKISRANRNLVILKSNNCVIYRCKSRREAHAFVLANQTRPLLYLAASNEIICQHWMKSIRDGLWPPNAQQAALENEEQVFPVSLVDNEYSFRANLVGIYGYIGFDLPHKLVLRNSQDGTLVQDWVLNTVSMRLVGEAAQESFALIERVSLNNEHVFVEVNADFAPNHVDQDENLRKLGEQLASECNLVLMNCSMDATTGPGLITFFSENAYQLVRQFKEQKQKDLNLLRAKQQGTNRIMIEDLIADSDEQPNFELGDALNEKLSEILHRKLSNALLDDGSQVADGGKENVAGNRESATNLKELIGSNRDAEKRSSRIQFEHKLPFYASTSELLDNHGVEQANSFENSIENSLDSLGAVRGEEDPERNGQFERTQRKRSQSQTQEFEWSLSSTSDE